MENIEVLTRPLDKKTIPLADTEVAKVPAHQVLGKEASADTFELGSVHTMHTGSSSTGIKCPFREESIDISPWIQKKGMEGNRGNDKKEKKSLHELDADIAHLVVARDIEEERG
jgi:hypothetical protein